MVSTEKLKFYCFTYAKKLSQHSLRKSEERVERRRVERERVTRERVELGRVTRGRVPMGLVAIGESRMRNEWAVCVSMNTIPLITHAVHNSWKGRT